MRHIILTPCGIDFLTHGAKSDMRERLKAAVNFREDEIAADELVALSRYIEERLSRLNQASMANYTQIRGKVGDGRAGRLARFGGAFCSKEKRNEVEVFFSAPDRDATGLDRTLSMALESVDRCVRYTRWVEKDVHTWLEGNAPEAP